MIEVGYSVVIKVEYEEQIPYLDDGLRELIKRHWGRDAEVKREWGISSPPKISGEIGMNEPTTIRFKTQTVDAVKDMAFREGLTVSAWIRKKVQEEVRRQEGSCPTCGQKRPIETS
jgi:hypothetical protein